MVILKIITCFILASLPLAAHAQSPMAPQPVEGHATPSWVNAQGAKSFSESQLKDRIDALQYGINTQKLQAGKNGSDSQTCKTKGSVKICQKN